MPEKTHVAGNEGDREESRARSLAEAAEEGVRGEKSEREEGERRGVPDPELVAEDGEDGDEGREDVLPQRPPPLRGLEDQGQVLASPLADEPELMVMVGDGVPGARPDLGEEEAGGQKKRIHQAEGEHRMPDEDPFDERRQTPLGSGHPIGRPLGLCGHGV